MGPWLVSRGASWLTKPMPCATKSSTLACGDRRIVASAAAKISFPGNAGADRLSGRLLNFIDLAKQILQLRVGLPEDSHAGEVADIALMVGAGIQGEHVAFPPEQLLRWSAFMARSRGD